jgi:signal peptide peptidase SppA
METPDDSLRLLPGEEPIVTAVRAWLAGHVWALDLARLDFYAPRALEHWAAALHAGDPAAGAAASAILAARGHGQDPEALEPRGPVAHVPVYGFLSARPSLSSLFFGGTSFAEIRAALARAVASPRVRSILLEIDSPGGAVYGAHETFQAIRAVDAVKPVTAAIGGLGASAAYWLASACRRISLTPSGDAGGIGVYGIHQDRTQFWAARGVTHTIVSAGTHKTEGLDVVPMTDAGKARLQRLVDQKYAQFVDDVAAGRRAAPDAVRVGYGEGGILGASDALQAGLVDAIEPVDSARDRMAGLAADANRRAELAALAGLRIA